MTANNPRGRSEYYVDISPYKIVMENGEGFYAHVFWAHIRKYGWQVQKQDVSLTSPEDRRDRYFFPTLEEAIEFKLRFG